MIAPRLAAAAAPAGGKALHYGLFFDKADLPRIRDNFLNNPAFAELRAEMEGFDYAAEYAWMDNDLRYNDQLFDIARLGRTAEESAFLFLMTGGADAEAMAKRAIREIMKFERWDFFLDGDDSIAVQRASSSTFAVALVADFLGAALDPEERRSWIHAMGVRGCEPCFRTVEDIRHPQTVKGWRFDPESTFFEHRPGNRTDQNRRPEITFNTNLRAVPASALVMGAVTYRLQFGESADTRRWTDMGVWGVEGFRAFFKADGSYDEEVNYANYTAKHIAQTAILLRRHGGPDLTDVIDWDAYTEFMLNMTMPTDADTYTVVNWGDSGNAPYNPRSVKRASLPNWIAAENRNGLAQWFAANRAGTHTYWSPIWHDPAVSPRAPENRPKLWVSDLDRVVARTGYDAEHLVVALRSGPPANHEHADRNGLIVKCFGQELVSDPLRPPYSYSDPAWRMRLTEGHSAVLIDGRGHEHHNGVEGTNASQSYARIVDHAGDDDHAWWISDASQPYRLVDTDIKSVVRSVVVFYALPAVVVIDRVTKWKTPSFVQSRFFGYNYDGKLDLSAGDTAFTFRRPGAVLRADIASTVGHHCLAGMLDVPEERAVQYPFVDAASAPAMDITLVSVLSMAKTLAGLPKTRVRTAEDDTIFVNVGDRGLRIREGRFEMRSA